MAKEKLLIDLWAVNMNEVDTSDCTDVEDILSAVITYLSEQPTVDAVEVVHGRWVSVPHKLARVCSVCNRDEPYKFSDIDADVYDYCPHCGAKIDGERKDNG